MAGASMARVVRRALVDALVYCVDDDGEILAFPVSVYASLPTQIADRYTPVLEWESAEAIAQQRRARS